MGQHRLEGTRPRYGRLAAALASLGVTLVALLGGIGVLPSSAGPGAQSSIVLDSADSKPDNKAATTPGSDLRTAVNETPVNQTPQQQTVEPIDSPTYPVPARSGHGKRVVFSQGQQRVWLVRDNGSVERTYLVSGSLTDNLDPGTYSVYSRSEQAWGIDDSGTMKWFVRFTTGDTGAAIGFHDIPVDDGKSVQSKSQLGTPQSHGCIRQKESDAKALWAFAPIESTVVVTA